MICIASSDETCSCWRSQVRNEPWNQLEPVRFIWCISDSHGDNWLWLVLQVFSNWHVQFKIVTGCLILQWGRPPWCIWTMIGYNRHRQHCGQYNDQTLWINVGGQTSGNVKFKWTLSNLDNKEHLCDPMQFSTIQHLHPQVFSQNS